MRHMLADAIGDDISTAAPSAKRAFNRKVDKTRIRDTAIACVPHSASSG